MSCSLSTHVLDTAAGRPAAGVPVELRTDVSRAAGGELSLQAVVAVGPGGLDKNGNKVEMVLKLGDKVLYQKYAGTEFKIDDEEHLVMHQDDVLALVEG